MKTFILISFIILSFRLFAQVAINTDGAPISDPSAMLEIKKGTKSKVKIRSLNYNDTAVLELSNRTSSNLGTDFLITARQEQGLFFTTSSDLPGNINDSLFTMNTNGNIGIGTLSPVTKLDIKGDVNVTGTIKANGVDGEPNQVLMKNNSGVLAWGDMSEFKEHITFVATGGVQTWIVPAGINKIKAEVWGAGGGGSCYAGGGGGGYITGYFSVTPSASVTLVAGIGGGPTECGLTTFRNGALSRVTVGGITITAAGGVSSYPYDLSTNQVWLGRGGSYTISDPAFRNWMGIEGEDGEPNQISFIQPNATTYWEVTYGGKGGNSGNTIQTGSGGGCYIYNMTGAVQVRYITPGLAKVPGGGGSGNTNHPSFSGGPGAHGLVVIHY